METARNEIQKKGHEAATKGREVANEANTIIGDFAKKAEDVFDSAMDSPQAKAVVKAVDGGLSNAGEWLEGAEDFFADAGKKATSLVKKYPLQALAIGLGVGALIATVVRGARRD